MRITPATVAEEHERTHERAHTVITLINETRERLGERFETDVDPVTEPGFRDEVDAVFANGERAVNVTGYACVLRELDVEGDYPGFVVDEVLGRELAATIAGGEPLSLLAQATFHYADATIHTEGVAGADDLDAALAAGFQTRLPGWSWREGESPFAVDP